MPDFRNEFSADEEKAMRDARVPTPRPDPRPGGAAVRGAYRDLRTTPPVTVMEDVVGRFSESKGNNNALRDAIRDRATNTIKKYPEVSGD